MINSAEAVDPRRPVVLCADDFALAPGVDEGIAGLAEAERLSAISCMAVMTRWPAAAQRLEALGERCDVGLHLTLTDQAPLGRMPGLAPGGSLPALDRLLTAGFTGRLRSGQAAAEVRAEVKRQWDAFVQARGRLPDFIDGHQHIHLLPGVREVVLELISRCPEAGRPWLRVCWEPPASVLRRRVAAGKAMFLAALSLPLRRAAGRRRLAMNTSFRGVYGFEGNADYPALFRRFLEGPAQRPLIMCHPGLIDEQLRALDPVVESRRAEHAYFASSRFAEDLQANGVRLARFRELPAG